MLDGFVLVTIVLGTVKRVAVDVLVIVTSVVTVDVILFPLDLSILIELLQRMIILC